MISSNQMEEQTVFTILLVEDDAQIREVIEDYFASKSN